jgi:uncharacterized protein YhfF
MAKAYPNLPRFTLGDSVELTTELIEAVLSGLKTATCWAQVHGTFGAGTGTRFVLLDAAAQDRAVVEVIDLTPRQFNTMDEASAKLEGEGDLSLAHWRAVHEGYFGRQGVFAEDMSIWFCRFRLIETLPVQALAEGAVQ